MRVAAEGGGNNLGGELTLIEQGSNLRVGRNRLGQHQLTAARVLQCRSRLAGGRAEVVELVVKRGRER